MSNNKIVTILRQYIWIILRSIIFLILYAISGNLVWLFCGIVFLTLYSLFDKILLIKNRNSESFHIQNQIVNDKVQDELVLKKRELHVLWEVSDIITSAFDVEQIIQHIYQEFKSFTGCDRYFICLMDEVRKELVCRYEFGDITFNEVGLVYDEDTSVKTCFRKGQALVKINALIKNRNTYGDKLALPLYISQNLIGVIFVESGIPFSFKSLDTKFLGHLANFAAVAIHNAELFKDVYMQKQEIESLYEQTAAANEQLNGYIHELNRTKEELNYKNSELLRFNSDIRMGYLQTVIALANSIQAKDAYTMGHCQRVMEIACQIASSMNYSEEEIIELCYSAILHDIGKIGIPASILNKCDSLSSEEYEEIKKHPLISYNILKDVEFLKYGLDAILQHHERYDGKGYPLGLKGNQICLNARILCIADAFDAMTSNRPYRGTMTIEQAIDEIIRCKGMQFDPEIADLFASMAIPVA